MKVFVGCSLILALLFPAQVEAKCDGVNLVIMRHGHAEHILWNKRNSKLSKLAREGMHLTQRGVAEVTLAAQALLTLGISEESFTEILSSPLPRTEETAAALIKALSAASATGYSKKYTEKDLKKLEKSLNEWHKRRLIKYTRKLVDAPNPVITIDANLIERDFAECENLPFNVPCKSDTKAYFGESYASVALRAKTVLDRLSKKYCSSDSIESKTIEPKTILISTHDIVAKQMIHLLTQKAVDLKPGEFTILPLAGYDPTAAFTHHHSSTSSESKGPPVPVHQRTNTEEPCPRTGSQTTQPSIESLEKCLKKLDD